MAIVEANTELGRQVVEDAKRYVLHSWSVQNQLEPLAVAGAEGRYFWDYEGNRYLDFASQLVNVSIGHQHPKVVAAIKEQAERLCTIGPPLAGRARDPRRRPHARPLHVPLPGGSSRPVPRLHRSPAPRGDPPVRGPR